MGQRGQLELGWGYLERGDTGSCKQRPCIRFVLCVSRFLFCVLINPLGRTQWSLAGEGMVGWPWGGPGHGLDTPIVLHMCPHTHTHMSTETDTDIYTHMHVLRHVCTWRHRDMDTDRHENVVCIYTDTVVSA